MGFKNKINKMSFAYLSIPIILSIFSILVFVYKFPIYQSWQPKQGFNLTKIIMSNFVHESLYHISMNLLLYLFSATAIVVINRIYYKKQLLGTGIAILSLITIFIITPISAFILLMVTSNSFVVYGFSCVSYAIAGLFIYTIYKLDILKRYRNDKYKLNITLSSILLLLLTISSFKKNVDIYGHLFGLLLGIVYIPTKEKILQAIKHR